MITPMNNVHKYYFVNRIENIKTITTIKLFLSICYTLMHLKNNPQIPLCNSLNFFGDSLLNCIQWNKLENSFDEFYDLY